MHTERKRYFDPENNRLVYFWRKPDPAHWDDQWNSAGVSIFERPPSHRFLTFVTRRHLPRGARVLEGGCGLGDKVYALDKAGFDAYGVDFAPKVVGNIRRHWPHLNLAIGDVRRLPFPDAFFDGYWSLGVIEHFFDGFEDIAEEMARVLRIGGYLFLTFPMLNAVRRTMAAHHAYEEFRAHHANALGNFYQFALDPVSVIKTMTQYGFTLVSRGGMSSRTCLSEEYRAFERLDRWLDRLPFGISSKVSVLFDLALGRYVGHSAVLVLRRVSDTRAAR